MFKTLKWPETQIKTEKEKIPITIYPIPHGTRTPRGWLENGGGITLLLRYENDQLKTVGRLLRLQPFPNRYLTNDFVTLF